MSAAATATWNTAVGSYPGDEALTAARKTSLKDPAREIARWLLTNQQPDGRVRDPLHGDSGTYAAGLSALTFALMAERSDDPAWTKAAAAATRAAEARPPHSEFDQFGLMLLQLLSPSAALPPLYWGKRLVSNNWVAMRAFNYTLRAHFSGSRDDAHRSEQLWDRVLDWQLQCGLFVDSPGGEATPVAYHAKFCAMLALAAAAVPDFSATEQGKRCLAALERGLGSLLPLISPSGVLAHFGRSRNTLFGQAAAIFALQVGGRLLKRPECTQAAGRALDRLRAFIQPDGHIPCVLDDGEAEKRDWDAYVNNPDYNAYAAALLLLSDRFASASGARASSPIPVRGLKTSEVGPLLVVETPSTYAVFVTRGQCVPLGTPFFCDHRYYGMQPLWIESAGASVLTPEPYKWAGGEDRRPLVEPTSNCWLPWVEHSGSRWCVRRYEDAEVTQTGGSVRIRAVGDLEAFASIPRWERGVRSLLSSWTGDVPPVFRRRALDGVRLERVLHWSPDSGTLESESRLLGVLPSGARFHASNVTRPIQTS